eukprot:scaffold1404_cov166-Amphora_coffeaeformis.AAC.5
MRRVRSSGMVAWKIVGMAWCMSYGNGALAIFVTVARSCCSVILTLSIDLCRHDPFCPREQEGGQHGTSQLPRVAA